MRVRVCRCTGRLGQQARSLLPRAGFVGRSLEVGFWGRLDPRLFPVASEDSAFWAITASAGLGFHAPFRHRHHSALLQRFDDCYAGVTGRGEACHARILGTVSRRLERERVYRVFVRFHRVRPDVHRTCFLAIDGSVSGLIRVQKAEVERRRGTAARVRWVVREVRSREAARAQSSLHPHCCRSSSELRIAT